LFVVAGSPGKREVASAKRAAAAGMTVATQAASTDWINTQGSESAIGRVERGVLCVRACVRACVHASMCACVRASMRASMRAYVYACVRLCVRTSMRAYVYACVRLCVRACLCLMLATCY
jgi:hypothetical protein